MTSPILRMSDFLRTCGNRYVVYLIAVLHFVIE